MGRFILISAAILALGVCAWATTEVATLSSPGPFELRGAYVTPGHGVPAWPALVGDKIASQKSPVTCTFGDGSLVILGTSSQAVVEMAGRTPIFRLQSGTAQYALKSLTAVKLMALKTVIAPTNLSGHYGLNAALQGVAAPAAGLSSGAKAALALTGAASASALGYSISQAAGSGSSVSGSK